MFESGRPWRMQAPPCRCPLVRLGDTAAQPGVLSGATPAYRMEMAVEASRAGKWRPLASFAVFWWRYYQGTAICKLLLSASHPFPFTPLPSPSPPSLLPPSSPHPHPSLSSSCLASFSPLEVAPLLPFLSPLPGGLPMLQCSPLLPLTRSISASALPAGPCTFCPLLPPSV